MSLENLEKFRKVVLSNDGLQQQLRATQSQDEFILKAVELAKEHKYSLTTDEVKQELEQIKQRLSNEPQLLVARQAEWY